MTTAAPPRFDYVALDKARDGTFLRIRAIRPDDRERLSEVFRRLSPESLRARWHGAKLGITAGEIVSEIELDPEVHVGLVATVWIEGREAYHCRREDSTIPADPHYTIRAWRAVVTYLLRRPEFLYE